MIAALSGWHEQHEVAAEALAAVTALPAHVCLEAYSVLTRMPRGLAVAPPIAASALTRRFGDGPLALADARRAALPGTLAAAGILGGAAYDALVALEAAAHERTLLTLDERAELTYRRLGVAFRRLA